MNPSPPLSLRTVLALAAMALALAGAPQLHAAGRAAPVDAGSADAGSGADAGAAKSEATLTPDDEALVRDLDVIENMDLLEKMDGFDPGEAQAHARVDPKR